MLAQGLDILPGPLLAERSTLRLGGQAWAELLVQNEQGFGRYTGQKSPVEGGFD